MARNKNKNNEIDSSTDFAKHAQQDKALRQQDPSDDDNNATTNKGGLSLQGRVMVFVVFPITAGTVGLYMGYLESMRKAEKIVSFDQDFVMPFLLALAMACVLFFQTGGFSTKEVKPFVAWPKVRRVKKVVKKSKATKLENENSDSTTSNNNNNNNKKKDD